MFFREIYEARRKKLRSQFGQGKLLFLGNEESGMNYADNTYPFRQDSTFLYYFGISRPGLAALIDIDNDKEYLFGDDATIDSIIWTGSQPTLSELASLAGVRHTDTLSRLKGCLSAGTRFLPPYRPEHILKLSELLGLPVQEVAHTIHTDFIMAVGEQRNVKAPEEIVELDRAASLTADMHRAAMRYARAGMTEAMVTAKVHETALAAGGNIAFPIIATINGQFLHNHYHGNTLRDGQLFLLDAGYETPLGYAGDMSSTFPVSATFTERQKAIYRITLEAHNGAIGLLRPGINFRDVHLHAARTIFNGLKELGLTRGDTEEAVSEGAHALFFPCGTGHLMGLDVHDMENLGEQFVGYNNTPKSTRFGLKSLRLGRELQPGYVLTIEPGIYFTPELIDHWHGNHFHIHFINYDEVYKYRNFGGIRNEEDLLITADGHRILGKPLAKNIGEVEAERTYAFQETNQLPI